MHSSWEAKKNRKQHFSIELDNAICFGGCPSFVQKLSEVGYHFWNPGLFCWHFCVSIQLNSHERSYVEKKFVSNAGARPSLRQVIFSLKREELIYKNVEVNHYLMKHNQLQQSIYVFELTRPGNNRCCCYPVHWQMMTVAASGWAYQWTVFWLA